MIQNKGTVPKVYDTLLLGQSLFLSCRREDLILKEWKGHSPLSRVGMNRLRTRDGSYHLNCPTHDLSHFFGIVPLPPSDEIQVATIMCPFWWKQKYTIGLKPTHQWGLMSD